MTRAVARDQFSAGGLALLVHVFFFAALMFGVSWKRLPEVPVYADLWRALPSLPEPPPPAPPELVAPEPVKPPPAKPAPVKPAPVKPVPAKPVVKPPPAAQKAPDIALKDKQAAERKRAELEKQRQEAEKRAVAERQRKLDEEMQRLENERLAQEEKQLQLRKEQERKAAEAKRKAQEQARKDMEAQLAADMDADLEAETRAIRQQAAVSARLKLVDEYKARIQAKVKGLLNNPAGLDGKPEAVYRVELLPNGEVVRAVLVKSSGQAAYDRAVESAILKASPLPLPPDRDAAAAFRDGLELRFRPD